MIKITIRFCLLIVLIASSTFYFTSCGSKPKDTIDAGITDSTNAKYKDNKELQAINSKILENPSVDSFYLQRANIYLNLEDYELAIGDAQRAIHIDSMNAKNYLMLTDVYYRTNQTRLAKETLERCIKNIPNDKEALLKMGELYFYVKNYQVSIDFINKVIAQDQYNAKAYFLKGMNYLEIGDTTKAVSSIMTAIEQDNMYYTAYMQLATVYYAKKSAACLDYYDNALRINSKSIEALYGKGKFLQDMGKVKEAKSFYLQILTIDPKETKTLYNLGAIALGFEKDAMEGKRYFTEALAVDPKYTEAWFARGVCFEKLRDKKNAIADYKIALKLTPNFEPAVSALNKIEGGK